MSWCNKFFFNWPKIIKGLIFTQTTLRVFFLSVQPQNYSTILAQNRNFVGNCVNVLLEFVYLSFPSVWFFYSPNFLTSNPFSFFMSNFFVWIFPVQVQTRLGNSAIEKRKLHPKKGTFLPWFVPQPNWSHLRIYVFFENFKICRNLSSDILILQF